MMPPTALFSVPARARRAGILPAGACNRAVAGAGARPRRRRLPAGLGAALLAVLALAGCAGSPPVRYYTLVAPAGAPAAPAPATPASYLIEVLPVTVPAQVDQPQLMLRSGTGQVVAQYSDRWSAPLPDELRDALSDALTRQLGVPDVRVVQPAGSTPVWRVMADVQRFEASAAGPAVIEATWRVRRADGKAAGLLCRSRVDVPVDAGGAYDGTDRANGAGNTGAGGAAGGAGGTTAAAPAPGGAAQAVVRAQQEAVSLLARTIASAIQAQARAATPASDRVQLLGCINDQG